MANNITTHWSLALLEKKIIFVTYLILSNNYQSLQSIKTYLFKAAQNV